MDRALRRGVLRVTPGAGKFDSVASQIPEEIQRQYPRHRRLYPRRPSGLFFERNRRDREWGKSSDLTQVLRELRRGTAADERTANTRVSAEITRECSTARIRNLPAGGSSELLPERP